MQLKYTKLILILFILVTLTITLSYLFSSKKYFFQNQSEDYFSEKNENFKIIYTNNEYFDFAAETYTFREELYKKISEWPYDKPTQNEIVVYGIYDIDFGYIVNLLTRNSNANIYVNKTAQIFIPKNSNTEINSSYLTGEFLESQNGTKYFDSLNKYYIPDLFDTNADYNFNLPFFAESLSWRLMPKGWYANNKYDLVDPNENISSNSPAYLYYNTVDFEPELAAKRSQYVTINNTKEVDMSGVSEYLKNNYEIVAPEDIIITGICYSSEDTNPHNLAWVQFKTEKNLPFRISNIDSKSLKIKEGQTIVKGTIIGNMVKGEVMNPSSGLWFDSVCGTSIDAYWPHIKYEVPNNLIQSKESQNRENKTVYFENILVCKDYNNKDCYTKYICGSNNKDNCYIHSLWTNKTNFISSINRTIMKKTNSFIISPATVTNIKKGQVFKLIHGEKTYKTNVKIYSDKIYTTQEFINDRNREVSLTLNEIDEDGRDIYIEISSYTDFDKYSTSTYKYKSLNRSEKVFTGYPTKNLKIYICEKNTENIAEDCKQYGIIDPNKMANVICKKFIHSRNEYWIKIGNNDTSSEKSSKWIIGRINNTNYLKIYNNSGKIEIENEFIPTCT